MSQTSQIEVLRYYKVKLKKRMNKQTKRTPDTEGESLFMDRQKLLSAR